MRFVYFVILTLVISSASLRAQTNISTNGVEAILALVTTNSPPPPKPPEMFKTPRGPLIINSDGPADFSINGQWVTYCQNVSVTDSQMKLTCEWLEANLPLQTGEHFTNIVARTNVVVDFIDEHGQKSHATGDK